MRSNRPATTAVSALWPKSRERYKIPFFLSFLLPNNRTNKMVVEKTNTQTNNKVIPAGGWRSRRLFRVYKQSPRTRKKRRNKRHQSLSGPKSFGGAEHVPSRCRRLVSDDGSIIRLSRSWPAHMCTVGSFLLLLLQIWRRIVRAQSQRWCEFP